MSLELYVSYVGEEFLRFYHGELDLFTSLWPKNPLEYILDRYPSQAHLVNYNSDIKWKKYINQKERHAVEQGDSKLMSPFSIWIEHGSIDKYIDQLIVDPQTPFNKHYSSDADDSKRSNMWWFLFSHFCKERDDHLRTKTYWGLVKENMSFLEPLLTRKNIKDNDQWRNDNKNKVIRDLEMIGVTLLYR